MRKKHSRLRLAGGILLIMVVVVFVIPGALLFAVNQRLEARLSAIRRTGEIRSLADLKEPSIPDERNAAVVLKKAFKALDDESTRQDLYAIGDFLSSSGRAKDPLAWDKARKILARRKNLTEIVFQATERPDCSFGIDWSNDSSISYTHLVKTRSLARLMKSNAMVAARDGRADEALRFLEAGLWLGQASKHEHAIIPQITGLAVLNIVMTGTHDAINGGDLNGVQLRHLYNELAAIDPNPSFIRAMQGERVLGLRELGKYSSKREVLSEMLEWADFGTKSTAHTRIRNTAISYAWKPLLSPLDKACYLNCIDNLIKAVGLTYSEAESRRLLRYDEELPSYAVASKFLTLVYARTNESRMETLSRVRGTQVFLALHAYQDRFGSYPSTLKELRSGLGWRIPEDPITGRDFIYRKQGKGFLLYSVGLDLKDDGGRLAEHRRAPGDIVWRSER